MLAIDGLLSPVVVIEPLSITAFFALVAVAVFASRRLAGVGVELRQRLVQAAIAAAFLCFFSHGVNLLIVVATVYRAQPVGATTSIFSRCATSAYYGASFSGRPNSWAYGA